MLNLFRKNKLKSPVFNWQETSRGIQFTAPSRDIPLTQSASNLPIGAYQAQAQWLLLKELLDNGQAEASEKAVHIPFGGFSLK